MNAHDDPLSPVELGASIFVEVNEILKNSSEFFELKPRKSETESAEILGIWDGSKFVYTQKDSGWYWLDVAKLIWKYGLAPIRTQRLMKAVVGRFRQLYKEPYFPFRSLSAVAEDLDLISVTAVTGEQFLSANNIGAPFTTDVIQASTRVNYGQNLGLIHGLETMVCMAIDGAMQIEGGNWQIFDGMLRASNATVLLNNTVETITRTNRGRYTIKTTIEDTGSGMKHANEASFDTVVLASPLQFSNIEIENDLFKHKPDEIPYVTLHVTLFTSPHTLSPEFFNLAPSAEVPTTILTTLPPNEIPEIPEDGVGSPGFFSISTLRTVVNPKTQEKEHLYKIFSPRKVTSEFLCGILGLSTSIDLSNITSSSTGGISWYYPHIWKSYPYEYPRVTFEELELSPGFYYTSGIESFISTMETSALMGMNVAQLVVNDYMEVLDSQHTNGGSLLQKVLSGTQKDAEFSEL